ncbi:putative reverse transcriptase domain-containing protein [Tanacetum coccineum]
MEEINNFQQEQNENLYQAWERFKELLMKCPRHYLVEIQEVVLSYNGLDIPTRQILDSKGVIPSKTAANVKIAIQEMVEYSQKWHNGTSKARSTKTSNGLAAIQAQLNNLGREIKMVIEKVYAAQTEPYTDVRDKTNDDSISMSFEWLYGPKFSEAYSEASHIDKSIPRKEKDPGSFTLPCFINNVCFDNSLIELGASISVMPLSTYLNLGLGELAHTKLTIELADRTVKYPKGIAKNVLVGIHKFTFTIDFIILDIPKDIKVPLILGRPFLSTTRAKIDFYKRKITLRVKEEGLHAKSLEPFLEDYFELNDLNEPFELRRQGDDLMPTIEEGEVIDEFRTRNDKLDIGIYDYPSYCDYDKKIHIDCAHNLILENMNAYRDEGMGNVIFGEPFLREVRIKARQFEGMITIYNGDDKVSEKDEMNGISHAYQKLKGFYKGVLNLGPDYIRDEKTKEWLTRGHIRVHEME